MTLRDLIVQLQEGGPAERQEAAATLLTFLRGLGHLSDSLAAEHEDAVQNVLLKLLQGTRPAQADDRAVRGYLNLMVRNHQLSHLRRRKHRVAGEVVDREEHRDAVDQAVDPVASEVVRALRDGREADVAELEAKSRASLSKVFEEAVRRQHPAARERFQCTWAQLVAIHLDGASVADVLRDAEGVTQADSGWIRAVNRLHTAHRRARLAALAAVESLAASSALDPEEADLARRNLTRLLVRQKRTPRASHGGTP